MIELAFLLGYKPKAITYILYKIPKEDKYTEFEILKKNGDSRKIKAPTGKLKRLQRRLADLLNECFVEIYDKNKQVKPLSHGFRKKHSIISNAKKHKNRRHVFNIDLQDFFPSINFGRVRGYFIKNRHFALDIKVATIIAQIACHENELPQGSPCSPVISNLVGHILDIRMVNLAKKAKCTYSRYADDLTFSTNEKDFPKRIATKEEDSDNEWKPSEPLRNGVEKTGFTINVKKTSMQYKTARQMTTGLIVNKKINIRKEYYKKARSMCYELFKSGEFYINKEINLPETSQNKSEADDKGNGTIYQLEGILSFIYHIKSPHYIYDVKGKRVKPTAITNLYRKFLFYKHFFSMEKPLIIFEGKTDVIYLKCALKQLKNEYEEFVQGNDNGGVDFKIRFLNMSKSLTDVFDISTGASGLLFLINMYEKNMKAFKGEGRRCPVIILVDNDDGANKIKNRIKNKLDISGDIAANKHYKFIDNLYIMFVPEVTNGAIEDLFDTSIFNTKLNGKTFNRAKDINEKTEYGKIVFAEKVIKVKQKEINFDNFKSVFDRFKLIIKEYGEKKHNEKGF
ncbi:MAG: RNA-directed DNA polymerase [Ignavibacteriae bacterium]|nr:RNA-directed DNA polymerase [Ignavibacteriota bacterium]